MHKQLRMIREHLENPPAKGTLDERMTEVLERVASCPECVEGGWHPLGFMHVKFDALGESGLRLHIWPALPPQIESLGWGIHTHNWSLQSYLLCGSLVESLYEVKRGAKTPLFRIYFANNVGLSNTLQATAEVANVWKKCVRRMSYGTSYALPPSVFHSVEIPRNTLTATILLKKDERATIPEKVIGPLDALEHHHLARRSCSKEEVAQAVLMVIKKMIENRTSSYDIDYSQR